MDFNNVHINNRGGGRISLISVINVRWAAYILIIGGIFHTDILIDFIQNSGTNKKHPASFSSADGRVMLMSEVRGECSDFLSELTGYGHLRN